MNLRRVIPIIRAESLIPRGIYCYQYLDMREVSDGPRHAAANVCPFWSINKAQIEANDGSTQRAGYCGYLKLGDWMEKGTDLLWDQVKECGIKTEDEFF